MPMIDIDGIATHYEVVGAGPPLLMFAPGGFDATADKWRSLGKYRELRLLDALPARHTCILFDRRESGRSGGRVERLTWAGYAAQGRGLLDHLGYERAHLMGGCMGCPPALALAVANPERVAGMVLYWPVGGARWRIRGEHRLAQHLAYVEEDGLAGVVDLARSHDEGFGRDPRVGPWAPVIRRDPNFASSYAAFDTEEYRRAVVETGHSLFDRDTAPGAEAEELLDLRVPALVVPGQDPSHPTSAARYLEECLPRAEYWNVPVEAQTIESAPRRILEFLAGAS